MGLLFIQFDFGVDNDVWLFLMLLDKEYSLRSILLIEWLIFLVNLYLNKNTITGNSRALKRLSKDSRYSLRSI